jgi:hypothetical protein
MMAATSTESELLAAANRAFERAEQLAWKSHDPFDLLLSPYARVVGWSSLGARAWIQVGRRSGSRVRRALRVPPHREAKAVADFLRAAVILGRSGDSSYPATALRLAGLLDELSVPGGTGRGWGLSFRYVSRFGRVEESTPNAYTTINAAHALLDQADENGAGPVPAAVIAARDFLLHGLGRFSLHGGQWFRYTASGTAPIVNIQASAAGFFARLAWAHGDGESAPVAHAAAEAALGAQRHDGSWPYSADGRAEFVDGFHTGFTLEGLAGYRNLAGKDAVAGTEEAVARGFAYFEAHLLTPEGLPRALADGAASTDAQNAAQCVQTLIACGTKDDLDRALGVWRAAVSRHLDPPREELLSLRWNIGPAVLATAVVLEQCRRLHGENTGGGQGGSSR